MVLMVLEVILVVLGVVLVVLGVVLVVLGGSRLSFLMKPCQPLLRPPSGHFHPSPRLYKAPSLRGGEAYTVLQDLQEHVQDLQQHL